MNAQLVIMLALALLLLRGLAKDSKYLTWAAWGASVALLIQPVVALLKWLGGLVGV